MKIPNADRIGRLHVPDLPSLANAQVDNDNDDDDDNVRIQPVSIVALKEAMNKKVQKSLEKSMLSKAEEEGKHGGGKGRKAM